MSETEDHRPDIAARAKLARAFQGRTATGSGGIWNITEKDGRYFIKDRELPMDHPEEWQSIIVAEMAKNYLK